MARIVITAAADSDVADIIIYLDAVAGRKIAAKYVSAFDKIYDQLQIFPRSGSPKPALGTDVRVSVVDPFVIIYKFDVRRDFITILRILHGRRRLSPQTLLRKSES